MNILKPEEFEDKEDLYDFVMSNNKEEWFIEMETGDFIGSHGSVISKKGKFRKPSIKDNYLKVGIVWLDGKLKNFFIHRLIALYFIPNDDVENKTQVDHIDSDRMNNNIANLRWVTPRENRENPNSIAKFKAQYNEIIGVSDNGDVIHVDFLSELKNHGFSTNDINIISKCCKGDVVVTTLEEDNEGVKIIKTTTIDYSSHMYKNFCWNYVERTGRKRKKR